MVSRVSGSRLLVLEALPLLAAGLVLVGTGGASLRAAARRRRV